MPDTVIQERELLVLVKMLGMLGSDQAGERAAAAAKVDAWVKQRGLAWAELLIPPEDAPVEVEVKVGGRKTASAGPPPPGNTYQVPPGAGGVHDWSRGPAWGSLVEEFLSSHTGHLRGDRELNFMVDQLDRAGKYGNSTRLSDKQENWMRDILGRAGLTW